MLAHDPTDMSATAGPAWRRRTRGRLARRAAAAAAIGIASSVLLAAPALAAPLANGSFEDPAVGTATTLNTGATIGANAWVVDNGRVELGTSLAGVTCHSGQCVHLNGEGVQGTIKQTIDTPDNARCTLGFRMNHGRRAQGATVHVLIDGNPHVHDHTGDAWRLNSETFTSRATTDLRFISTTAGPSGALLDDVTLSCEPPPGTGRTPSIPSPRRPRRRLRPRPRLRRRPPDPRGQQERGRPGSSQGPEVALGRAQRHQGLVHRRLRGVGRRRG